MEAKGWGNRHKDRGGKGAEEKPRGRKGRGRDQGGGEAGKSRGRGRDQGRGRHREIEDERRRLEEAKEREIEKLCSCVYHLPVSVRTTQRFPDHREATYTEVVWTCLPFIGSDQNHLAKHGEREKKTRQTGEEVGRRHQGRGSLEFTKSEGKWKTESNGRN